MVTVSSSAVFAVMVSVLPPTEKLRPLPLKLYLPRKPLVSVRVAGYSEPFHSSSMSCALLLDLLIKLGILLWLCTLASIML